MSVKKESYRAGAVKMMSAGIVVRFMGFANRIFMSNLIGAEGMGLFQLTSPVYSLIILTLTAGVSVTVSGMAAAETAVGRESNARRITKTAFFMLLILGSAAGLSLALAAKGLAAGVLHDERTYLSLVMLAPCIPAVASASALKGYFYGTRHVGPNAAGQIVEQAVRIGVIFMLARVIAGKDLAYACALATVSSAVGEIADLLVVSVIFFRQEKRSGGYRVMGYPTVQRRQVAVSLLRASLPVSAGRFLTSVMGTLETIVLPMRFVAGGYAYKTAIEILGKLSGMAMPILTFPSVLTSALATTLVPAIAEARSRQMRELAASRIYRCIRLSFFMGFSFFGLFYAMGGFIGDAFYPGQNAGEYLTMLAPCCVLLYFQQTMSGILHGLEKQTCALLVTVVSYGIRIAFIWFLLPGIGVYAYIIGILCGMLISSVITLTVVCRETGLKVNLFEWIVWPAVPGLALALLGALFR